MASVTTSLNALTLTTNSENNLGLQYKILRTSSGYFFDGSTSKVVGTSIDNAFELCVQEIERQVQAAIEEGFVPHGSLAHSFAPGKLTCFMTQTMVKQQ